MIRIRRSGAEDLCLEGGRIVEPDRASGPDQLTVDARDLLVIPGLIDMHVHLREPGREDKETIATGTAAALAGGFTSVVAMANSGIPCDTAVGITYVLTRAREAGRANVFPVGAVSKGLRGEELAELGRMAEAGAVAFSDDGHPIMNSELMRRALEYSRMLNRPVLSHCEDAWLTRGALVNEGRVSAELGLRGWPSVAEAILAARDIYLAALTGGHVHLQHVSTRETVDLVRRAKKMGIRVTAEATPHHLTLTEECLRGFESRFKVNPPLRTKADVEAVVEGVADGTIDAIATDHAPHTPEEKDQELAACPCGVVGLETALGVVLSIREIPRERLFDALTTAPARILGLSSKGRLDPGADADVTIIDPRATWTVDSRKFRSRGRSTPFEGRTLTGRAVRVFVGGRECS